MSSIFDREMYGFRFVESRRGDSLQIIAARELGDAGLWADLVSYNDLVAPFITDDPELAGDRVLLTGELLLVPAPSPVVSTTTNPDEVFLVDIALASGGQLQTDGNDFVIVSGRANLRQALKNAIDTDQGELIFHTKYGSLIRRLLGTVNGPTAALLASQYARAAVLADTRISSIESATGKATGDKVEVTVVASPIVGRTVQASTVI